MNFVLGIEHVWEAWGLANSSLTLIDGFNDAENHPQRRSRSSNLGETIEERLVRCYTADFKSVAGMSHEEASVRASTIVECGKKAVVEWEWDRLPPDFGDVFLKRLNFDPDYKAKLERFRDEGVHDEDIRWWWNLPPLIRAAHLKSNELVVTEDFLGCLEHGDSFELAGFKVCKINPLFFTTSFCNATNGDGRPLPEELWERAEIFTARLHAEGKFHLATDEAPSYNALVRRQIKRGNVEISDDV